MKRLVAASLAGLLFVPGHLVTQAHATPYRSAVASSRMQSIKTALAEFPHKLKVGAALAIAATGGLVGHNAEIAREAHIPLAFSEYSQIERDAAAAGVTVSPATHYLALASETPMKVFEASNLAHEHLRLGSDTNRFAKELAIKMRTRQYKRELPDLFDEVPVAAREFRLSLQPIHTVAAGLAPVSTNFQGAYSEWHHDNTHQKRHTSTRTVTDANGKTSTVTDVTYETVYDNTDHSYTYDRAKGEAASTGLSALRGQVPSLSGLPSLRTTSATHAQGEYAAETSRKVQAGGHLSQEELTKIANTWATGATYTANVNALTHQWNTVIAQDAATWQRDKITARSTSYRNTTHGYAESGPREFRTTEQAAKSTAEFMKRADAIFSSVSITERNLPLIESKIQDLLAIEIDKTKTGDSKQLAKDIMKLSREMYGANFVRGVDTKAYRGWVVLLYVMAGLAVGGAGAAGAQSGTRYLRDRLAQARGN